MMQFKSRSRRDATLDESLQVGRALLGRSDCCRSQSGTDATEALRRAARYGVLERLAPFSPKHAEELRRLQCAGAASTRERELMRWCAQFSTDCEIKLRQRLRDDAQIRDERWRTGELRETLGNRDWDPSKHPRGYFAENPGWFSPTGGGSAGRNTDIERWALANEADLAPKARTAPLEPSEMFLPSKNKGKWSGREGNSTFTLKGIKSANAKPVKIPFVEGYPILDKVAKGEVQIVLTGDSRVDIANAKAAWRRMYGNNIPKGMTFHHDLLHVVEDTVEHNGKEVRVLVGKMQLVPRRIHQALYHQGSASVAKKVYEKTGIDIADVKRLAGDRTVRIIGRIAEIAKKIKGRKLLAALLPFVGRGIKAIVPFGTATMAIIEFSDNAEAHGVAGAVVRATPLLGEVVGAYDLGNDLARHITDTANAAADEAEAANRARVQEAWRQANEQTIEAFHELASQIRVTNERDPYTGSLIDANEVAKALDEYRTDMQSANWRRLENSPELNFEASAAAAKGRLRERLNKAAQEKPSPPRGPARNTWGNDIG